MRIAVLGLGYVGTATAACLAAEGHDIVGVDPDPVIREALGQGCSPIAEDRLEKLVIRHADRITVAADAAAVVADADLSLVCVGTPSAPDGSVDCAAVERAAEQIGAGLARRDPAAGRHTVVFRSTMPPGTCASVLVPALERASGLRAGEHFGVAVNPEFLREGSSVDDFRSPSRTVVGQLDEASGDAVVALHADRGAPVFRVALEVAEMTKYADNAFHALKVGFVNEMGSLARALGVDYEAVSEVFLADHTLNVSEAYLRPGFAFGGSCLPKDLRALTHTARAAGVRAPVLENLLASNEEHLRRAEELVLATGAPAVGVFGLAFKPGTDDLRESPMVALCSRLLARGVAVRVYDPRVFVADRTAPAELADVLVPTARDVLPGAGALVAGFCDESVRDAVGGAPDLPLVDLVGLPAVLRDRRGGYTGVAW